jgi:hypothetical protein
VHIKEQGSQRKTLTAWDGDARIPAHNAAHPGAVPRRKADREDRAHACSSACARGDRGNGCGGGGDGGELGDDVGGGGGVVVVVVVVVVAGTARGGQRRWVVQGYAGTPTEGLAAFRGASRVLIMSHAFMAARDCVSDVMEPPV